MIIQIFEGLAGTTFRSDITSNMWFFEGTPGMWYVDTPSSSSSFIGIQYDGFDNSYDLNITGLNINLFEATHFTFYVMTNQIIFVDFYDFNGNLCSGTIPASSSSIYAEVKVSIPLSSFIGNCDRTSIGAIEIYFDSISVTAAQISRITLDGPIIPFSRTPSFRISIYSYFF